MSRSSIRLCILSVEDNAGDRLLIQRVLASSHPDCELISLPSGMRALREISTSRPDIVILDLNLYGIDGAELLREIRETVSREVPVLVFTGSDLQADVRRSYRAGADCYVIKPDDYEKYFADLSRAIAFLRRSLER
jgi:two-component system response regulator